MSQAKYIFWQSSDGDWRWHLKAPNGRVIASGEGYTRRQDVVRGIATHRKHAATLRVKERM